MHALLRLLGNPERSLRVVQVVGTNGKGTTAVSLAGALDWAGESAGAYLSPHVLSYTERVVLGGNPVREERFAATMQEAIDAADGGDVPATQFELLTAGALKMFHDVGVRWAVLEAGLGARHDATSAAEAKAVVLTNVGLDHTQYLGETVHEIALEKLASLKPGAALILGAKNPEVLQLARSESERVGAGLIEFLAEQSDLPDRLAPYAADNARLGVRAAEVLLGRRLGAEVWERVVESVNAALPGRFDVREVCGVPVVVDGGHNPEGLRAALAAMRMRYGERPLGVVFGCLRDKDVGSMLTVLEERAEYIALTRPDSERAAEPEWIRRVYTPRDGEGREAHVIPDAGEALSAAVKEMGRAGGAVLVAGSLSTCAPVLRLLAGASA